MSKEKKEERQSSGFLRVADAAELIGRSREWTYTMLENGTLASEERLIEGRGLRPVTLITLKSIQDYINAFVEGRDDREKMRKAAYNRSCKIRIVDFSAEDRQDICARYQRGENMKEIAVEYSTTERTISSILHDSNVQVRDSGGYQERRFEEFLATIPDSTKKRIRRLYEDGYGLVAITEDLGWKRTQQTQVRRILQHMGVTLRGRRNSQAARWGARNRERKGAGI